MMAEETEDVLSRAVALRAGIEGSCLTVQAKSRAVAAFDRLIGAALDWPAAALERRARRSRAETTVDEVLIETRGRLETDQVTELGRAVLERQLRAEQRRQWNIDEIALQAAEQLQALPPTAPHDPTETGSSAEPDAPLDDDWLNSFARYAADASSARLQSLWARILAGEVRQPGLYSRSALRFICELDAPLATECELVAERSLGDFAFNGGAWTAGTGLTALVNLETHGVLSGVGGTLARDVTLSDKGEAAIPGRLYALKIEGNPGLKVRFPIVTFTRLGIEIFSLLPPPDEKQALRELCAGLDKGGFRKVTLASIVAFSPGNLVQLSDEEPLWSEG